MCFSCVIITIFLPCFPSEDLSSFYQRGQLWPAWVGRATALGSFRKQAERPASHSISDTVHALTTHPSGPRQSREGTLRPCTEPPARP